MPNGQLPRIHPTAVISPQAELAADVQVGPYVVIEGAVRIGPGCILRPQVHLVGPLTLGRGNQVFTGAVLGERPQHLKYQDEPTSLEIGDDNVFREHVTVHRGTKHSWTTRIGHRNYFMAHCHIAHDCQVGNQCILANGALLAGHCVIEDNAYLSGNCAIHQFCRVGRLALLSGCSVATMDLPPFVVNQGINCAVGVNIVGMRRAGMPTTQINAVRRAFHILFREGQPMSASLAQVEQELGTDPAVAHLITFIRSTSRGISSMRDRGRESAA
jgi:UDP-N-acetylglucosamine acyltransferase